MVDMGRREPALDEPLHPLPLDAPLLTPPFENVVPEATDREAEVSQSIPIPRNSEVPDMPTYDGLQPLANFRSRIVHAPPQLSFHFLQLGLHALANRLPKNHEPTLLRLPADVREAEEVEGFRFTHDQHAFGWPPHGVRTRSAASSPGAAQLELLHSFFQLRPEPFGIVLELEPNHDV